MTSTYSSTDLRRTVAAFFCAVVFSSISLAAAVGPATVAAPADVAATTRA